MKAWFATLSLLVLATAVFATSEDKDSQTIDVLKPMTLLDVTQLAPSFLEEAATKLKYCGKTLVCPIITGTCCKDKKTCCAETCKPDGGCDLSPEHRAIQIAKIKMQMEAKQQIKSEQGAKSHSESGKKRASEADEKAKQEQQLKVTESQAEQELKKEQTAKEGMRKKEAIATEEATKEKNKAESQEQSTKAEAEFQKSQALAQENTNKAAQEALGKTNAKVAAAKSTLIKNPFNAEKSKIIATADKISFSGEFTYMFWINPSSKAGDFASILHKCRQNQDNDRPSLLMKPGSTEFVIYSGTSDNNNEGFTAPNPLPVGTWTHVTVAHGKKSLALYINGMKTIEKQTQGPVANEGDVYVGDPFRAAFPGQLADVRYFPDFRSGDQIQKVMQEKPF